nr:MAG TPA: hypothetical protein [Caudoviricetes sp.]
MRADGSHPWQVGCAPLVGRPGFDSRAGGWLSHGG